MVETFSRLPRDQHVVSNSAIAFCKLCIPDNSPKPMYHLHSQFTDGVGTEGTSNNNMDRRAFQGWTLDRARYGWRYKAVGTGLGGAASPASTHINFISSSRGEGEARATTVGDETRCRRRRPHPPWNLANPSSRGVLPQCPVLLR